MQELNYKKIDSDDELSEEEESVAEALLNELNKGNGKDVLQLHSEKLFVSNLKDRTIWIDLEIHIEHN